MYLASSLSYYKSAMEMEIYIRCKLNGIFTWIHSFDMYVSMYNIVRKECSLLKI